jgi:hypothetical protein
MGCRNDYFGPSWEEEAHKVTDLLCRTLACIETDIGILLSVLPPDVQLWWAEHKAADAKRRAEQRENVQRARDQAEARDLALSKLSDEEKRVLGLK